VGPDRVGEFVHLFPPACEACAALLPETPDPDPKRYQVFDLLVGGGLHVTEYQRHEVRCRCGHRTRAPYDAERIPSSPFGPRLTTWVAMLTGVYHLSRRGAQQLLRELVGVTISLGAISTLESRASEGLVSATEEAKREVEGAPVKHADATSWLLAGITMSLWTIASQAATVYKIFSDGCRDTIRPWFGKVIGILVSDRATVFDFWAMALRQICHAHLIRRFVLFSQRDGPAGTIGRELLDLSALVFHYWHGFKAGKLTRALLQQRMRPVQEQFEAALQRGVAANIPRLSGSCADILEHKEALWNFVTHDGVEPTNNHAELMLRPLVLLRKKSYGCQSERGLRFVERIMTVTQTARKQGKDVLDFIMRCVNAKTQGTTPPSLIGAPT
jgi:transposase